MPNKKYYVICDEPNSDPSPELPKDVCDFLANAMQEITGKKYKVVEVDVEKDISKSED